MIKEAEKWIEELGYSEIYLDSRTVAVGFYEKLGYTLVDGSIVNSSGFECKRMYKSINR